MGAYRTLCVHFSYSSEVKSQRAFHIHSCLASFSACPAFKIAWQERNYNRWGELRWEDSANKDQRWQSSQREEEQDSEAQAEWQVSSGAKKSEERQQLPRKLYKSRHTRCRECQHHHHPPVQRHQQVQDPILMQDIRHHHHLHTLKKMWHPRLYRWKDWKEAQSRKASSGDFSTTFLTTTCSRIGSKMW